MKLSTTQILAIISLFFQESHKPSTKEKETFYPKILKNQHKESTRLCADVGGLMEGKEEPVGDLPRLFLSRRSPNLTISSCSLKGSLTSLET